MASWVFQISQIGSLQVLILLLCLAEKGRIPVYSCTTTLGKCGSYCQGQLQGVLGGPHLYTLLRWLLGRSCESQITAMVLPLSVNMRNSVVTNPLVPLFTPIKVLEVKFMEFQFKIHVGEGLIGCSF